MNSNKTILLTIDVEDWFQVENFKPWIPFETWDQCELRVERNVHHLLNLFDSVELKAPSSKLKADNQVEKNDELSAMSNEQKNNGQRTPDNGHTKKVQATFFVLGWLAERLPNLIREIHSRGHEVASHGYNHTLANQQSHADLKKELIESKKLLGDIIGAPILGFRAPNFSIDDGILKLIEDCGYFYDSSYNSFGLHGRYGKISMNGHKKFGITHKISNNFFELPISNLIIRNPMSYQLSAPGSKRNGVNRFVLPWGGGAYFRMIPFPLFSLGLKNIIKKEGAYLFYIHPWEVDFQQPKLTKASIVLKLRHYINLSQTERKLAKLIKNFRYCQFTNCCQYLKHIHPGHN